jgi:hypothetical protein
MKQVDERPIRDLELDLMCRFYSTRFIVYTMSNVKRMARIRHVDYLETLKIVVLSVRGRYNCCKNGNTYILSRRAAFDADATVARLGGR